MRPLIGINCDYKSDGCVRPYYFLERDYSRAVEQVGGMPILLPILNGRNGQVEELLGMLSGLILSGGKDINPSRYGQEQHPEARLVLVDAEKEEFDFKLTRAALELDMPILGICYGGQLLNVCLGGSLLQDIPAVPGTFIKHRSPSVGRHKVLIERGTLLHGLLGVETIDASSTHHQAIDRLGGGLRVCARAEDGLIEAVEGVRHRFVLAVQWHPERMLDEPLERRLFKGFIEEARAYALQRV